MTSGRLRGGCRFRLGIAWLSLLGALISGTHATAQQLPDPRILPGSERSPLPLPERPGDTPSVLPPAPVPGGEAGTSWTQGLAVQVNMIEIAGNTVLSPEVLEAATRSYVGRVLVSEDLLDLQRRLTRLYVEAGYVTSFAMLPDQDLGQGVLRVQIVEARLADVEIEGLEGFDVGYIERRLVPSPDAPLNVTALEQRLQVLQHDPRIDAVRARLSATPRPGAAILHVEIVEAPRLRAQVVASNDRPPAIGETNARLGVGYSNLLGRGDDVSVTGVFSKGLNEVVVDAAIPVTRFDTTLGTRLRYSGSKVVDSIFADLDVEADFWSVALALQQPIIRSRHFDWRASVIGELRQSKTLLGGEPFEASQASVDGKVRVAALRFSTQAIYRDLVQVFAARTMVSVGLPILGASITSEGVDDGKFVSWLGQLQWTRRLPWFHLETLARVDWQLAWAPLPPFERFGLGGVRTVRGYSENLIVRDNGVTGSFEVRWPIIRGVGGQSRLAIASFIDGGRAWFHDRGPTPEPDYLAGVGLGLLAAPRPWLDARIYWGHQLISVPVTSGGFQSQGIYFSIALKTF